MSGVLQGDLYENLRAGWNLSPCRRAWTRDRSAAKSQTSLVSESPRPIMISMENFYCWDSPPPTPPTVFLNSGPRDCSSTDSNNKLTLLNCSKWELSEKLIDTGERGRLARERLKPRSWQSSVLTQGGQAPLPLRGVKWAYLDLRFP